MPDFDELSQKYQLEAYQLLTRLISFETVYDPNTVDDNNPYGKKISQAFTYLEKYLKEMDFHPVIYNNRVLEVKEGTTKNNLITVASHLDVVPRTDGFSTDPFILTKQGEYLIGRGVTDDKGPLVATIFALKLLKDQHLIDNYSVNLLFGGDEERGSSCLKYYYHRLKKPYPNYGFTPDADFPLIYGEKGILTFTLSMKTKNTPIETIQGGDAPNIVIDKCSLLFKDKTLDPLISILLQETKTTFATTDQRINLKGVPAHGMSPSKGKNVGLIALKILGLYDHKAKLLSNLVDDLTGKGLGIYASSPNLKESTLNLGLLEYQNNELKLTFNYRFPETINLVKIKKAINEASKKIGVQAQFLSDSRLLYYPLDSKLVSTLYHVYQQAFDDRQLLPLTSGGGTYAKESENMIAFGPMFEAEDSYIHGDNERLNEKLFYKLIAVYAQAIYELGQLNHESQIQSKKG